MNYKNMKSSVKALTLILLIMVDTSYAKEFKLKSSTYTKSCPEGKFVIKKLTYGMKTSRYHFVINQSNSLQKLLQSKEKSEWFRQIDAEFDVNFPRISKQTSYIMVYKALQHYSASIHVLIQKSTHTLRKDLISIRNELRKLMCSVEGLLNGMQAEQRKNIREKDMEIWLNNALNTTLSPLAISRELIQSLMEFNQIVLDVANKRLKNLAKQKRKRKQKKLIN